MNVRVGALPHSPAATQVDQRLRSVDWAQIAADLDADGHAIIKALLSAAACTELVALFARDALFRKRIVMEQHGYGQGQYSYFAYPLPALIERLRAALYAPLVPIANRWNQAMGIDARFPAEHAKFIARCHAAGQNRPTPLLLNYAAGDYNRLHQDLHGEHIFPLQVVTLLSDPHRDFEGGELVMTEQRPRMQSRPMVLPLERGDATIIAVHQRPVRGARGWHRVTMRHGVSRLRSGHRQTLGIIFHDAE